MSVQTYGNAIKANPPGLIYDAQREQLIAHTHAQEKL